MNNLTESEQDLLAKARAAYVIPHGPYRQWWEYNRAATPAAIIDLLTQLREAREVIAKLPLTADGVPIVPGMVVWSQTPKAHTVTWIHDSLIKAVCHCHHEELTVAPKFQPVYSTRKAALAAQSPAAKEAARDAARTDDSLDDIWDEQPPATGEGEHGKI